MRRVQRAVQVLSSAVAVALVFAGVALLGSHRATEAGGGGAVNQPPGSGTGPMSVSGGTGPASPTGPTGPTGEPATPTTPPTPASTPQISRDDLISTLKTLFNGTGITGSSYTARGSGDAPTSTLAKLSSITVGAQLSAHHDAGFLEITVSGPRDFIPPPGAPQPQADRSVAYVSQQPGTSDGIHEDKTALTVTVVRTDGSSLSVLETNSATEKGAAAPGAPLLLSAKQIIAMLDNPAWDAAVAAADALEPPVDRMSSSWTPSGDSETAIPPETSSSGQR